MWNTADRTSWSPLPLAPDHQVDSARVPAEAVLELTLEEEHHDHRRDSKHEQDHGQDRGQRAAPDGAHSEDERIHAPVLRARSGR